MVLWGNIITLCDIILFSTVIPYSSGKCFYYRVTILHFLLLKQLSKSYKYRNEMLKKNIGVNETDVLFPVSAYSIKYLG